MNQRRKRTSRLTLFAAASVLLFLGVWIPQLLGGAARTTIAFGFNSYVDPSNVALQRTLDVPVRRMLVYWNQVEPSPGHWNWQPFDQAYDELLSAGLKPEITLMGSPCWARASVACNDAEYTGPPDPGDELNWSQFVKRAAQRYDRAIGFEIWSEPNLVWFFYPRIDPARYARLLEEAYRAIKSVDRLMPVASGGLAPAETAYGAELSYKQFVADMYAAGAGSNMNALAIHVYPTSRRSDGTIVWSASQFEQILNQVRFIRDQHRSRQPIWVTEVGESTGTEPGAPSPIGRVQQASDLITIANEAKADHDVGMMLIHTVQDTPNTPSDPFNGIDQGWGAFTSTGAPKPLACALAAKFGGSLHCPLARAT